MPGRDLFAAYARPMRFLALAMLIPIGWASSYPSDARCPPELAERIPIPNSSLVILTQAFRCSATDAGETRIFILDQNKNEEVDLLWLNGEEDTKVSLPGLNTILISMPNMVDVASAAESFRNYAVKYQYLPKDDPAERAKYVYWLHHPSDPVADAWYRKNFLEKIYPGASDKIE